jgi:hypothetical protein
MFAIVYKVVFFRKPHTQKNYVTIIGCIYGVICYICSSDYEAQYEKRYKWALGMGVAEIAQAIFN